MSFFFDEDLRFFEEEEPWDAVEAFWEDLPAFDPEVRAADLSECFDWADFAVTPDFFVTYETFVRAVSILISSIKIGI